MTQDDQSTTRSPSFPPDRSHIGTEQRNPRSMNLHALSITECVQLINEEDHLVAEAVANARDAISRFIQATHERFNKQNGRLIYLGAGTSGRLGVLDASEAPPTFQLPPDRIIGIIAGGDSALRKSSEGMEDDPHGAWPELEAIKLQSNDTVIGIASGATTPYVLGAFEFAKRKSGALTGFLTCSPITETQRPPHVDHLIVIDTGSEILTGSTRMKAGTATKMALNIISTTLMVQSGRVYENLMVDLKATNNKLRDRAARIITMLTELDRAAAFDLLGRAEGNVKCAIVMHRLEVSQSEAERLLRDSQGNLQQLLDS